MSSIMRRGSELLEVARTFRARPSDTDSAIYQFLSSLDTPKSLAVWLLYESKEHDQLVSLSTNAIDYENNPYRFRLDYCATEFLSKASFLKTSFNRETVALEKFEQFELLCRETNIRFRSPLFDPLNKGSNVWLLNATRRKIEQILGEFCGEEFVGSANWGPGVSTLVKGEHVSAINKFQYDTGITRDLYSLVSPFFSAAYPLWSSSISSRATPEKVDGFDFQVGNEIVTVPKNSKTDRVIAIEPGVNLWFQKAIGTMIRRRLQRVGVDLNSQGRNQQLAWSGSCTGRLATVDFSSASDSIALEVVRELIPPRWFQLMDACRSKIGVSKGSNRVWNKFSSMGNGFTFELESLIFYAAALAVAESPFSSHEDLGLINVYGDDVIIHSTHFELYSSFCTFLGFKVNPKKSFSSGYFRESCGVHFYDGVAAKPIFFKEKLRNVESFYKLANSVRLLAHRHNSYHGCDSRFVHCWTHLLSRVPEPLRLRIPAKVGDGGFISNFDESVPVRARYGIEGYFYRAFTSTGVRAYSQDLAVLMARLWVPSHLEYNNSYTLRGRVKRTLSVPLIQQWYNLGEWY